VRIAIHGKNLPGRNWRAGDENRENVHVGVQEHADPVGLVAGDAASAAWEIDVAVVVGANDQLDFKGPAVHGRRGERFLYLTWGELGRDETFHMFRRAKLMLNAVDPDLVFAADGRDGTLIAEIDLTDDRGGPRCARVDPPALTWRID